MDLARGVPVGDEAAVERHREAADPVLDGQRWRGHLLSGFRVVEVELLALVDVGDDWSSGLRGAREREQGRGGGENGEERRAYDHAATVRPRPGQGGDARGAPCVKLATVSLPGSITDPVRGPMHGGP